MSSTAPQKSSASSVIIGCVIGLALMVGGMYVSTTWHPQFLADLAEQGIPLDLGKTVAVIGVFLFLFPVINTFFITPLATAIWERNSELDKTFSEAEELRAEMTAMRTEYERRMAAQEADAREQIQAQIKEAQSLRQTLMAEATAKADDLLNKANQEIEQERNRLVTDLRLEVINLTLAATEKLLGENIDNAKNRKLVEEFIDKIEVKA